MNARNVHAILAAAVQHPNLLAKWEADPAFLRSKGIEPETIDLVALRKFAGLTIKVKHNGLRPDFPLSFRFMSLAELDIAIFSSYATYCAETGHRLAKTSAERACDLISFLETWLDLKQRTHSLLWDMFRHEQALAQLKTMANALPAGPVDRSHASEGTKGPMGESSVPQLCGRLILHRMQSDPREIRPALFQRPFRLDQIPEQIHFYCYWRGPEADAIQMLDLDEFGFYALKLIDNVTPLAELNRRMGGGRRPSRAFREAFRQLAAIGILHFQSSSKPAGK